MAQLWLYTGIVLPDACSPARYPRAGEIFLPRRSEILPKGDAACRCPARRWTSARDSSSSIGFRLCRRLHTTALVLREEQAESVLDLATFTGLQALVELALKPEDLLEPGRALAKAPPVSFIPSIPGVTIPRS